MSLLEQVIAVVPATEAFDPAVHARYEVDRSEWRGDTGRPLAIARPGSAEEVEALVRWARRRRVALVPWGAGSGVSGGANALAGCVVVSFERMTRIQVDAAAM